METRKKILLAMGLISFGVMLGLFSFYLGQESVRVKPTLATTKSEKVLGNSNIMSTQDSLSLIEIKTELAQIKAEQRALTELLRITGSASDIANILTSLTATSEAKTVY